ncbi:hypothetical protein ACXKGW_29700, partial [Klebsiella pneumoniae subsp. pneumoniae]
YFQRVVREFPGTHAAEHAQARLLAMRQRAREPVAIRDNRSTEAEKLYLTGYDNSRYSAEVRGISLYQIGLIYMSRYNDQRDDAKATDYFQRVVREFPGTHAAEHAQARLLAMRQRAREPV